MLIETKRLFIRDLRREDEVFFAEMAADGSLNDVGFDKDCYKWITQWRAEAEKFAIRDNPAMDYLAYAVILKNVNIAVGAVGCSYYEDLNEIGITYFIGAQYRNNGYAVEAVKAYTEIFFNHYKLHKMIATVRDENVFSWKVVEKAGFLLTKKDKYRDINDKEEKTYRFYEITGKILDDFHL